jgi:hypothetical protein
LLISNSNSNSKLKVIFVREVFNGENNGNILEDASYLKKQ